MAEPKEPLLCFDDIVAGYGGKEVLRGVSLQVAAGEIVAVIGHNGAGKSTLLKVAFGLLPAARGRVSLAGEPLGGLAAHELRQRGLSYVPQGNRVFPDLSVADNLAVGGMSLSHRVRREALERTGLLFPRLKERLGQPAATLSGGEKQMLALGMALMRPPRLLLLDEPSLGLAPAAVGEALARIDDIRRRLGTAVLLVEQKVREALAIADRVYVVRRGEVAWEGPTAPLRADEALLRDVYL